MEKRIISGTKEWAVHTVNCVKGCSHDCRYCFARFNAVNRFKYIKEGEWENEVINQKEVSKNRKKLDGSILFPSTHDIVPKTVDTCLVVLKKLLTAENKVLIVSKPHFECIEKLCDQLSPYVRQILLRFTIGATDNAILKYWEPGAPSFEERLASLKHAYSKGFATSVSTEPMLDPYHIWTLVKACEPFVTDAIWIGKMNKVEKLVSIENEEDRKMVHAIQNGQTDAKIKIIYDSLKDNSMIKWKESIKIVVGLPTAEVAGEDR